MSKVRWAALLGVTVFSLGWITGCGAGRHAIVVTVTPTTAMVQAGGTASLTATVTNDSMNKGVTWSVSCSASACGSVSPTSTASGTATTYTAPASPPTSNLTVTVTATSVADTTKSASATVTVLAITVSVSPSTAAVKPGATAMFTATVANDPATAGVTWTVSCSPAPCGSVSPTSTMSGSPTTYSAPATPPASNLTVTITATSVTDMTKSSSATVTVPAITVSVAPGTATVPAGTTAMFTATVMNTSNTAVTWTLTQGTPPTPCSPTCGTLSSPTANPVTYSAPATPPSSSLTVAITATSVADTTKASSATITVPAIAVSVSPTTASVAVNGTAMFTATVTGTTNTAVTWVLAQGGGPCASAVCGSLSSATANPVTYTAPATVPTPPTVTITATSAADTTKSASATITVTASATACPSGNEKVFAGQYAFLFQGYDTMGPVAIAGTFVADGLGGITTTTAVEDVNNTAGVQTMVSITAGSYSVGTDNRGCLTLTAATSPSSTTSTYRFALGSLNTSSIATSGRMIEFDSTGTLGSGVLRLQDPTAFMNSAISGNYAFGGASTLSLAGGSTMRPRFGVVGVFSASGAGTITTGELDENTSGLVDGGTPGPLPITASTYTVGANGRGTMTLHITGVTTAVDLSFYVISASELLFMDVDSQTTGNPPTTGTALLQSGGPFSTSSLSGNLVFYTAGLCGGCGPGGTVAPNLSVGVATITSPGNFSLTDDVNKSGTLTTQTLTGTYTVDASGRVLLTITISGATLNGAIYLVTTNQGFILIADNAVEMGTVDPQTGGPFTNASLNTTFFFGTTNQTEQKVSDNSGVATFDGVSAVPGTNDSASIGSQTPTQPISSTYSVTNGTGTPGRGTISTGGVVNLIFYIVSPSKVILVDATANTDPAITIGEK